MDIRKLFQTRKALIDERLGALLPKATATPRRLHGAMRYSVFSGGKRIRPILAIEGCLACGGAATDCLDAACAIELVHTFSLIHDDLPSMDNDDYRRGKLTCHKKFDEATAVLAGDSLLAMAFEILANEKRSDIAARLSRELAGSIGSRGMAGGQSADIEYEDRPKSPKTLRYINFYKTAIFIRAALKMGAIAADSAPEKIKALGQFGGLIGEAFQIIDDVLDSDGSVRTLGAPQALKKAKFLTAKAKGSLDCLAAKADTLRAIADCLIERKL